MNFLTEKISKVLNVNFEIITELGQNSQHFNNSEIEIRFQIRMEAVYQAQVIHVSFGYYQPYPRIPSPVLLDVNPST